MRNTVSERALIQRINRKIGGYDRGSCTAWGERLRKTRGDRWWSNLGSFYTVDWNSNLICDTHINLERYGREVGALAAYEGVQS
jgi:hypothetical protein